MQVTATSGRRRSTHRTEALNFVHSRRKGSSQKEMLVFNCNIKLSNWNVSCPLSFALSGKNVIFAAKYNTLVTKLENGTGALDGVHPPLPLT